MTKSTQADRPPRRRRTNLKVTECWLYAVSSPKDLARRLSTAGRKVNSSYLQKLAKDAGNFRLFMHKPETGKPRPIQEPKRDLQRLHGRIHTLLARVEVPAYLHSAVRGRSYISNAAAHDPSVPTIKIDIKKFFPSVTRAAIYNFFAVQMKCRKDVAGLLADFLTYDRHLPTGSAASPIISYYAHSKMFDEIDDFAKRAGLAMTCYVDDMTFSGAKATKGTLFEIQQIIARHGLKSHKKRAFAGNEPKVVTGVCITPAGPRVPNRLHLKIKNGFDALSAAISADARDQALRPLVGRLEAAGQIEKLFRARATTVRHARSKPGFRESP